MEESIVTFLLTDQLFGIAIREIHEIIRAPAIVSVPRSPEFVEGIVNLRGGVLPIIDLRRRFGFPVGDKGTGRRVIIADLKGVRAGFIVDHVLNVVTIDTGLIQPAPEILAAKNYHFITGMIRRDAHMILLLDASRILTEKERAGLGAVPK